jgi:hypothetical protein
VEATEERKQSTTNWKSTKGNETANVAQDHQSRPRVELLLSNVDKSMLSSRDQDLLLIDMKSLPGGITVGNGDVMETRKSGDIPCVICDIHGHKLKLALGVGLLRSIAITFLANITFLEPKWQQTRFQIRCRLTARIRGYVKNTKIHTSRKMHISVLDCTSGSQGRSRSRSATKSRAVFFCLGFSKFWKTTIHVLLRRLRNKHNLLWLRVSMSFHRFSNLRELFQGHLNKILLRNVDSEDLRDRPCNCPGRGSCR